ncbi:probable protein S-acyltransferase 16 [Impatiens glandulifera]|uniref:probable protein S-acyltransferase 16 n=1 Tax=Impatiens glandulifera TaxID=253017 RepID=UPI001FB18D33|nr:probable protein S-acyltransferase 16 [Impatiens glandulifera]
MKQRFRFSFPVTVVIAAIIYIYVSTVLVFVDQWFGLSSSPGIINAVAFTALALLCIYSYTIALFTDPGRVTSSFVPDVEDKLKEGDLKYCEKCSTFKPPRTHHCRVCKRCVLRMDHHCIWMNNCVGYENYKTFFVFVLYAVTSSVYSLVLLVGSILHEKEIDDEQKKGSFRTIYVISTLLLVPLTITLGTLLGWHIYLILRNKTTIEYHEAVRAMWLAEKRGDVYSHPYDLGSFENLKSVLGSNILCWVCPTTTSHLGSGLRFRTA